MNTARELKRESYRMLKGMWLKGAVLSAVSFLIIVLCTAVEEITGYLMQLSYFEDPLNTPGNYLDNTPSLSPAVLLLFLGGSFLSFFLSAPLKLGNRLWYLHLIAGDQKPLSHAFGYYRSPLGYLRAILFEARLFFRKAAVAAVCFSPAVLLYLALPFLEQLAVPYILFSLLAFLLLSLFCLMGTVFFFLWSARYFLAEYIYTLYACRMRDAFKLSVIIMKGRKTPLFSLILSFLPLYLADLLLLPRLWTGPRRNAAFARYAQHFMEAYEQAKTKDKATEKNNFIKSQAIVTREFPCVS